MRVVNAIQGAVSKIGADVKAAKKGDRAAALAGSAGGMLFGDRGAQFGKALGHVFTGITGIGDYKVKSNSVMQGSTIKAGRWMPGTKNSGEFIDVCQREFLFDLKGSVDFARTDLEINPGLKDVFPWASQMSAYFEKYKLMGCVFEFVTSSGQVTSVSPALGTLTFASEYDVTSSKFSTKQQAESTLFSTSGIPCANLIHPIECANPLLPNMLVRTGNVSDKRFYDHCRTSIITQGQPSVYTLGEVWISYHIRLFRPKIAFCKPGDWTLASGSVYASAGTLTEKDYSSKIASISAGAGFINVEIPQPGTYEIKVFSTDETGSMTGSFAMTYYGKLSLVGTSEWINQNKVGELQTTPTVVGRSSGSGSYSGVLGHVICILVAVSGEKELVTNYVNITGFVGMTAATTNVLVTCVDPKLAKVDFS